MSIIVDWLLEKRVVVLSWVWEIREWSYKASLVVSIAPTYSDSVVESITSSCFFALYEIASPFVMKAYPEVAH